MFWGHVGRVDSILQSFLMSGTTLLYLPLALDIQLQSPPLYVNIVKIREEQMSSSVGADDMQSELRQHQIPLINGRHVSCSFNELRYRAITCLDLVQAAALMIAAGIKVAPQMKLH